MEIHGIQWNSLKSIEIYRNPSGIYEIHGNPLKSIESIEIYPNPLPNNQVYIDFSFKNITIIEIILYDLTGKKVQYVMNETLSAGAHNLSKVINKISAGVYLLRVNVTDISKKITVSKTKRFIKL